MTIQVNGRYVVKAGQDLSFSRELAFHLEQVSDDAPPRLVNNGTVTASGDDLTYNGIDSDDDSASLSFVNAASGTYHFGAANDGDAVYFRSAGVLQNDGMFLARGGKTITGFEADRSGSAMSNSGRFDIGSDTDALGVVLNGSGQVDLAAGGVVTVHGDRYAIGFQINQSGEFHNAGDVTISSGDQSQGVGLFMTSSGAVGVVRNDGTLTVSSDSGLATAIEVQTQAGKARVTNTGEIRAPVAVHETWQATAHETVQVANTGSIYGAIQLGDGDNRVFNTGLVKGDVTLGGGDDLFSEQAASGDQTLSGKIVGTVYAGDGADTLLGGRNADQLFGDNGDGAAAGGRDLLQGFGANDVLHGEGGADTLVGGIGADVLSGGAGRDTFVFATLLDSTVAAPDEIADLGKRDRIDLSGIDADSATKGDQAFHLVAALTGHAGEAALVYDKAHGQTDLQLDVNGDGQADALVLIDGKHTDFTGFVL